MKTKAHWEECRLLKSYILAQQVCLQLKEAYKNKHTRGIKVLDKEKSRQHGLRSDAAVIWEDGPENWAKELEIQSDGVYCEVVKSIITFYDI